LLVKPGGTSDEPLDRRLRDRQPLAVEVVAQEVEALLDAPDEGLVRVLLSRFAPHPIPEWRSRENW
jgi:hypothetical protein